MNSIKELCTDLNCSFDVTDEVYDLRSIAYQFLRCEELIAEEKIRELLKKDVQVEVKNACLDILLALHMGQDRFNELSEFGFPRNEREEQVIGLYSQQANVVFDGNDVTIHMPDAVANLPAITIDINGRPINLLFDTGAMITTLSSGSAVFCGLIPEESNIKGVGSTGAELTVQPALVSEIRIGNLKLENKLILVIPDQMMKFGTDESGRKIEISGTIGWDVIKNFKWNLDMINRTISVKKSELTHSEKNMCCDFFPMIRILKNEKEMIFGLDTGANRTQFGKKMKNNFNDLKKVKRTIIGAGASIDEELFEANEFEFNIKNSKVTLQNIAIYDKDHSSSNFFVTPGIFGSDIFVGKKVVIDYPNRSLELED